MSAWQIQIQQHQVGVWIALESLKHGRDAVGLLKLRSRARTRDRTPERRAIQGMIINDDHTVRHRSVLSPCRVFASDPPAWLQPRSERRYFAQNALPASPGYDHCLVPATLALNHHECDRNNRGIVVC